MDALLCTAAGMLIRNKEKRKKKKLIPKFFPRLDIIPSNLGSYGSLSEYIQLSKTQ